MSRLGKQMKEDIIDAVANDLHDARNDDLLKLENVLANQILDQEIGAVNMKKMASLPANYFQTTTTIDVKVKQTAKEKKDKKEDGIKMPRFIISSWKHDPRYKFDNGYGSNDINMGKARIVPQGLMYGDIVLEKKDPLLLALQKYQKDRQVFAKEVLAAIAGVNTMVESVTTVKKLLEVWPEATRYIPKPEVVAKLPTVRAEDVNKLITCTKKKAGCE